MTERAARDRLRVLHLIKGLNLGGAEKLVTLLASYESPSVDYEVAYALAGHDQLVEELRAAGVAVHALGARSQYDLRWLARLHRLVRRGGYDIVHVHLPYTAGLGRAAIWRPGRRSRPRIVHTQHNLWPDTEWPTRALGWLTWWIDDADIAVSEAVKAALPRPMRRHVEVVLHGIDTRAAAHPGARERIRRGLGVGPDEILVVTVANLRREKGYDVLLEAAAVVLRDHPSVRFVAVGQGPLEAEVRALHRRLDLGERFLLAGVRRDVPDILAAADVFTLASRTEGFPVSVMEAFAAGLPIVATRVGHLPAVVSEGGSGLLVPPGDVAALAAALGSLVGDGDLRHRMGHESRKTAARFDIAVAAARIEEIYRRATAGDQQLQVLDGLTNV